ncbi:MAG TPA: hypothetical protein PLD47_07960, partial [Aggregatilineales bacterium]|nr:hypothetical protein [Aggregatilineales bacterium]
MARDDKRSPIDDIRMNTFRAMLSDAFFTAPSAITIGLTIIAFFSGIQLFPGMANWLWLAIGGVIEVIYLVATLTDPKAREQANLRILKEQFDPGDIRNLYARQQLVKALEYKRIIDEFVGKQSSAMRVALDDTASQINDWIESIYRLAKSIDTFESNPIIERDRRQVPTEIQALKRRLSLEEDPTVKAELQRALEIKESLAGDLNRVAALVKRIEIKMDSTIAQLSAVHAKMQLMDVKELDSSGARRLQDQIRNEVASLEDMIAAMDDVYSHTEYGISNLPADSRSRSDR